VPWAGRVAFPAPIAIVRFAGAGFAGAAGALEGEFLARLVVGHHKIAGNAKASIIGSGAPCGLAPCQAQQGLEGAMPAAGIRVMGRFRESPWRRRRRAAAIGAGVNAGVGVALALVFGQLRPLAARMREAPGQARQAARGGGSACPRQG